MEKDQRRSPGNFCTMLNRTTFAIALSKCYLWGVQTRTTLDCVVISMSSLPSLSKSCATIPKIVDPSATGRRIPVGPLNVYSSARES